MSQQSTVHPSVRCPSCDASHFQIEKQSFAKKAGKVGLFGVLALGSISKTFKCNQCGYAW